jgi:phosphomannomutase
MTGPTQSALDTARRWLEAEPDDDIRDELAGLIERRDPSLDERFAGRLQFGTAGLRAAVGAGSMRMNRLVVRQAAAGLARHLLATDPRARDRGVVVGRDSRRKSDLFALDTARVFAAADIRVHLFDGVVPTPVLAWSITGVDAVAGCDGDGLATTHRPITATRCTSTSGAQIVPPHVDAAIADAIGAMSIPWTVPLADVADHSLIEYLDRSDLEDAYLDCGSCSALPAQMSPRSAWRTQRLHGVGWLDFSSMHLPRSGTRPAGSGGIPAVQHLTAHFPTVSFPNPEEPGAMDRGHRPCRAGWSACWPLANDPDADRLGAAIPTR